VRIKKKKRVSTLLIKLRLLKKRMMLKCETLLLEINKGSGRR
jgi:hypothetical protein